MEAGAGGRTVGADAEAKWAPSVEIDPPLAQPHP